MKIEHDTIQEAIREWEEKGNFIHIQKEEVKRGCYNALPCSIGSEVPGLCLTSLAFGYSPLLTLSDSSQVDDMDLLDV